MKTKEPKEIPKTGEQPVVGTEDLDPRLKLFELDLNALCSWEAATGREFKTLASESLSDFRLLIWAGLKEQLPDITLQQVGSMITFRNTRAIAALIKEKTGIEMGVMTL